MIKVTAIALVLYATLTSFVLYYFVNPTSAYSCILGAVTMLLNLLGFFYIGRRTFRSRAVGLTVAGIILKYGFLAALLWTMSQLEWVEPIGFILGLLSLVIAILSMTVYQSFVRKNS